MKLRQLKMKDGSVKLQEQVQRALFSSDGIPIPTVDAWQDIPLVEEEQEKPKREPIKAWANVWRNATNVYSTKESADYMSNERRLECVPLTEIPEGYKLVSKEQLQKALSNVQVDMGYFLFKEIRKELGFGDE